MTVWDAVVVGAGPAGAVAARGLAREGLAVLLVDRGSFPRRKVCGACMGPAALAWMDREGLGREARRGGVPLTTLELHAGSRRATLSLEGHVALSRSVLDARLVEAAVVAGVSFRDGCGVRGAEPDRTSGGGPVTLETTAEPIRARVVVDAAGLTGIPGGRAKSRTMRRRSGTGLEGSGVKPGSRIGLGAVFDGDDDLRSGVLRMVVGRGGYVGMVRTEDGALNVAAAVAPEVVRERGPRGAVETLLAGSGVRLPGSPALEPWAGTAALTRRHPRLGAEGVLRIGDAAGYVEPFTGEGIGWAVGAAIGVRPFALRAVAGWNDAIGENWTREHGRVSTRARRTCVALAAALRRERLVRGAVALLSRAPVLAVPLLHATTRTPATADT